MESTDLVQQPAQQVRRQGAFAIRDGPDGAPDVARGRIAAPEHATDAGLHGDEQALVIQSRHQQHDALHTLAPERADLACCLLVHFVGHDQRHRRAADATFLDHPDPRRGTELRRSAGPGDRVGGGDVDIDRIDRRALDGAPLHDQHQSLPRVRMPVPDRPMIRSDGMSVWPSGQSPWPEGWVLPLVID